MDKQNENVALFDMDGTLCDYEGTLLHDLKMLAGPNEPEIDLHLDDSKQPQYLLQRMRVIKSKPGWWLNLPKLLPGEDIFNLCRSLGFTTHILTKGPRHTPAAWTEKLLWIQNHFGTETDVTITQDKGLVYGKVLVDDWPPYILRWLEWRPRGQVIMPIHSYNQDFHHPNVFPYWGEMEGEVGKLDEILIRVLKRK